MSEAIQLIDSHCHLDDDRFDGTLDDVLARARAAGVVQYVVPATTAARWPKLCELAERYPAISPAYGLHPWFLCEHQSAHLQQLDHWLDQHEAVALGECGLDFYQGRADEALQLELFRGQLTIAKNHRLPIILHARKSLDEILRELRRHAGLRGEVHSFSGSLQQAEQLIALGFKLGIAATISYERARKLREVVRRVDVQALLIESDAPDQAGVLHRGDNNEPAYIVEHLAIMAELKKLDIAAMAAQLNINCRTLFDL